MNLGSQRVFLLIGTALIVLANAIALLGVWFNRQPPAESTLSLTERELPSSASWSISREDSGLDLQFEVRTPAPQPTDPEGSGIEVHGYYWGNAPWLTAEKLRALGFDLAAGETSDADRRHDEKLLPREVFVVLEFNGDSYQRALQGAQNEATRDEQRAQSDPDNKDLAQTARNSRRVADDELNARSRLFCIDAGTDPAALRQTHADRSRYVIVRGTVRTAVVYDRNQHWRLVGQFAGIRIPQINVPLIHRPVFGAGVRGGYVSYVARGILGDAADRKDAPHYDVSVAWGRRLEPWIASAAPIASR